MHLGGQEVDGRVVGGGGDTERDHRHARLMATYDPAAIAQAMADAVTLANAQGVTDPAVVHTRMKAARERFKTDADEREIIDKAEAESASR